MAIGANWKEIWGPVWKPVWTTVPPVTPVFGEAAAVFVVPADAGAMYVAKGVDSVQVAQDDNVIRVPQEDYPAATIQ